MLGNASMTDRADLTQASPIRCVDGGGGSIRQSVGSLLCGKVSR
ncbi:MAG: hypothetical protein JWM99_3557, partial [Verrucomicrobiales bacterium]|nr:hypothetical protein [Verrucomicrobiales bacterium]